MSTLDGRYKPKIISVLVDDEACCTYKNEILRIALINRIILFKVHSFAQYIYSHGDNIHHQ